MFSVFPPDEDSAALAHPSDLGPACSDLPLADCFPPGGHDGFFIPAARQPTPTGTSKSNKRNQNLLV
jgi:hypothetical protein